MGRVLRPSIRQVAEDRLGLGTAAHPLEQVGQLVRRLGAQGAGRRVVSHRLLARRRPQPVQGSGQGVVDPDVAGVAAGRGPQQGHGRLGLADVRQGLAQQDGRGGRQLGRFGGSRQGPERLGLRLAVLGQEDRAQAVAIGSGSASRAASIGFRQAATGRYAARRTADQSSRKADTSITTASVWRVSRRANSAGSRASRSSPASRKAVA